MARHCHRRHNLGSDGARWYPLHTAHTCQGPADRILYRCRRRYLRPVLLSAHRLRPFIYRGVSGTQPERDSDCRIGGADRLRRISVPVQSVAQHKKARRIRRLAQTRHYQRISLHRFQPADNLPDHRPLRPVQFPASRDTAGPLHRRLHLHYRRSSGLVVDGHILCRQGSVTFQPAQHVAYQQDHRLGNRHFRHSRHYNGRVGYGQCGHAPYALSQLRARIRR